MRFFVDEDLDGEAFVRPLREAGLELIRHRDRFAKGIADAEWTPIAANQGWIVLSANTGMRLVPLEVEAIVRTGARVLYLRQGRGTTHAGLASLLLRSARRVDAFFAAGTRPRVGVLRRLSHAEDPDGVKPGRIEIPSAFQ